MGEISNQTSKLSMRDFGRSGIGTSRFDASTFRGLNIILAVEESRHEVSHLNKLGAAIQARSTPHSLRSEGHVDRTDSVFGGLAPV